MNNLPFPLFRCTVGDDSELGVINSVESGPEVDCVEDEEGKFFPDSEEILLVESTLIFLRTNRRI